MCIYKKYAWIAMGRHHWWEEHCLLNECGLSMHKYIHISRLPIVTSELCMSFFFLMLVSLFFSLHLSFHYFITTATTTWKKAYHHLLHLWWIWCHKILDFISYYWTRTMNALNAIARVDFQEHICALFVHPLRWNYIGSLRRIHCCLPARPLRWSPIRSLARLRCVTNFVAR